MGFLARHPNLQNFPTAKAFLAGRLLSGSLLARLYVNSRLSGSDPVPKLIREWLESAGTGPVLLSLEMICERCSSVMRDKLI